MSPSGLWVLSDAIRWLTPPAVNVSPSGLADSNRHVDPEGIVVGSRRSLRSGATPWDRRSSAVPGHIQTYPHGTNGIDVPTGQTVIAQGNALGVGTTPLRSPNGGGRSVSLRALDVAPLGHAVTRELLPRALPWAFGVSAFGTSKHIPIEQTAYSRDRRWICDRVAVGDALPERFRWYSLRSTNGYRMSSLRGC